MIQKKVDKPWGYEIIFTPEDNPRVGKIEVIKKGHRFSLQYHTDKEETLCLFQGKAIIWLENEKGEIEKKPMKLRHGYHIKINQQHRIEALEDSYVFEVSSPEKGTTVRVEDDYDRSNEQK
jgi:mannose-6-phosphate isomerase-like protein (cupin superfamily)